MYTYTVDSIMMTKKVWEPHNIYILYMYTCVIWWSAAMVSVSDMSKIWLPVPEGNYYFSLAFVMSADCGRLRKLWLHININFHCDQWSCNRIPAKYIKITTCSMMLTIMTGLSRMTWCACSWRNVIITLARWRASGHWTIIIYYTKKEAFFSINKNHH